MQKAQKPKVFILLGRGGAGKTEIGKFFVNQHGWTIVRLGNYIRYLAKQGDPEARETMKLITAGQYFSSLSFLERFMKEYPKRVKNGFVVDGFPRQPEDVKPFEEFLEKAGFALGRAIEFRITPEISLRRQLHRSRETKATIEARKKEFDAKEAAVIAQYRSRGLLSTIETNPNRRVSVRRKELELRSPHFLKYYAARIRGIVKTRTRLPPMKGRKK